MDNLYSWINEQEKIQHIENIHIREPMKNIKMTFVYIKNSSIEKVDHEIYPIDSKISKEVVLKIIQDRKNKYKLIDILTHFVTLEPENIQSYGDSNFIKVLPIIDEIIIPPSIFIFHDINVIYFFFEFCNLKSILKTEHREHKSKKVRIEIPNRKTRKNT
jgi:hypothetical protein